LRFRAAGLDRPLANRTKAAHSRGIVLVPISMLAIKPKAG
jgi:hypothetical protein